MQTKQLAQTVPPLVGKLPPRCREDLNSLRSHIYAILAQESPEPAVSAKEFKEILLIGATGFVGRFLLRELLRNDASVIVHCLVRADNKEHGFERVQNALIAADIWEEEFASRLRFVPGDLGVDRFGLADKDFDDLCQRIDAVHHLAANTSLVLSYEGLRSDNVLSLRPVLELCLRVRKKHLFFASTLAVFPEYFCNFTGEYSERQIGHHAQPDLTELKRSVPLGIFGYPWSKLISEQAVLFAKDTGLPVAIFRLPYMVKSSTGYMNWDAPESRLFGAMLITRKAPVGFLTQTEPATVDTACEVLAGISANPRRRYTIYHCFNPDSFIEGLELEDIGIYLKRVSYQSFRRACQALGEASPLRGQWPLLDRILPYWRTGSPTARSKRVDVESTVQDCPVPVRWPVRLATSARADTWARDHSEDWPYPPIQGSIDFEGLSNRAEEYAQSNGVRFSDVYPEKLLEGLDQLVRSLNAPDARLREERLSYIAYGLNRLLRNRAQLSREWQRHPEIRHREIKRPVFIVGINRTGTTLLHRLLARDPQFWALRMYEMNLPVMPVGTPVSAACTDADPRRQHEEATIEAVNLVDSLSGLHTLGIDEPEEDYILLHLSFTSWVFAVYFRVPGYQEWLKNSGSADAYAYHRRVLQYFTWQRQHRIPDGNWLLKMPFHLMELEMLLKEYPDAVFIQTHRPPVQFMGSWNSMVDRSRAFTAYRHPPRETGRNQLGLMSRMLNSAMTVRTSKSEPLQDWLDVSFADLVDDPMAVVRDIYAQLGWSLLPEAESAMKQWLVQQAEQRRKETRHTYTLEDYGLSSTSVKRAFEPYLDFVAERRIF